MPGLMIVPPNPSTSSSSPFGSSPLFGSSLSPMNWSEPQPISANSRNIFHDCKGRTVALWMFNVKGVNCPRTENLATGKGASAEVLMTAGTTRTVAAWSACSPTLLSGRPPYPCPGMRRRSVVAVSTSSPGQSDERRLALFRRLEPS